MQLTQHFTLEEFTRSELALRHGIDNTPPAPLLANLERVASTLEQIRMLFGGVPIIISSGYRCAALNSLVGSSPTSAHVKGLAADFNVKGMLALEACRRIAASKIVFDQLIYEFGNWVHLGLSDGPPRNDLLTITRKGTSHGLQSVSL